MDEYVWISVVMHVMFRDTCTCMEVSHETVRTTQGAVPMFSRI